MKIIFIVVFILFTLLHSGATPILAAASPTPKVTLGYTTSPRQFTVSVTNAKQVSYALTYKRTGSSQIEAIMGSGRADKNGKYSKRHYAGTQSGKYYIPHAVTAGTLKMEVLKNDLGSYTYTANFVIKKGKLVITSTK